MLNFDVPDCTSFDATVNPVVYEIGDSAVNPSIDTSNHDPSSCLPDTTGLSYSGTDPFVSVSGSTITVECDSCLYETTSFTDPSTCSKDVTLDYTGSSTMNGNDQLTFSYITANFPCD